jgi:hypothetical protein
MALVFLGKLLNKGRLQLKMSFPLKIQFLNDVAGMNFEVKVRGVTLTK